MLLSSACTWVQTKKKSLIYTCIYMSKNCLDILRILGFSNLDFWSVFQWVFYIYAGCLHGTFSILGIRGEGFAERFSQSDHIFFFFFYSPLTHHPLLKTIRFNMPKVRLIFWFFKFITKWTQNAITWNNGNKQKLTFTYINHNNKHMYNKIVSSLSSLVFKKGDN